MGKRFISFGSIGQFRNCVCYSNKTGLWVQSRKQIITPENDNAGCAAFVEKNKEVWIDIIKTLADNWVFDLDKYIIAIYFEWCGGSIQKKSAVSGLDKRAIIFEHFRLVSLNKNNDRILWVATNCSLAGKGLVWVDHPESNIFNTMNLPMDGNTSD